MRCALALALALALARAERPVRIKGAHHPLSRANTDFSFRIEGETFDSVNAYVRARKRGDHWVHLCSWYVGKAYDAKYEQNRAFQEILHGTGARPIREVADGRAQQDCPGEQTRYFVGRHLQNMRDPPLKAEPRET